MKKQIVQNPPESELPGHLAHNHYNSLLQQYGLSRSVPSLFIADTADIPGFLLRDWVS